MPEHAGRFPGSVTGPDVNAARQQELMAALQARLDRAIATRDAASILERGAVDEARQLAETLRNDQSDLPACNLLGWLYWYQFQALPPGQDGSGLDKAVAMFTRCFVAGTGPLPAELQPLLVEQVARAAAGLLRDARTSPDQNLISDAVDLWQRVVEASPAGHPNRCVFQANLGVALQTRFERTGAVTDLNDAIRATRAAVTATPDGDPARPLRLNNLGAALRARFGLTGNMADVDDAITAGQAAVAATPAGHPACASRLNNLGIAFRARFERTGHLNDLDNAVQYGTAAVDAAGAGHPELPAYLTSLANALMTRFDRTGALADLGKAVQARRAALDKTPASHPTWAGHLSNLGLALRIRFQNTGELADLDEAIRLGRAALDGMPDGHPVLASVLSNLGNALNIRFGRTGATADLDAAIHAMHEALKATPDGHPDRAGRLSDLGYGLLTRFGRTGQPVDLDEAVRFGRAAVDAIPADHPDRPRYLSNQVGALEIRSARTGALDDLTAAVQAARDAVAATPADHPDLSHRLADLSGALLAMFRHGGVLDDLEAAIQAARAALAASPDGHPREAGLLLNLGIALRTRFEHTGAPEDRDEASSFFVSTAGPGPALPSVRIQAAAAAASLLAGRDPTKAADLLEGAVELLGEVAPRRLARSDQQYAIGGFAGLASDAAGLVLADASSNTTSQQRATRALRLLEAGRGVLLSQALETRSDITELQRQHRGLADRFIDLRDRLDKAPDRSGPDANGADLAMVTDRLGRTAEDQRLLAQQFAETLAEIRALDGFGSFGLPPSAQELLAQAVSGPVVTFNVSAYRCDALLLTAAGITSVELPALTHDTVIGQVNAFHEALHAAVHAGDRADRLAAQKTLAGILRWLWDAAAEPVLNALGCNGKPAPDEARPRVWWAPGGLLGLLPIHAAGHHAEPASGSQAPRTVMDRVISSYTPTIRALRYARQRASRASERERALVVAMPVTPGLPGAALPHVPAEAARVRVLLPDPVILAEPAASGSEQVSRSDGLATRANVFRYLPGCSIAHFACHGVSDPSDPSRSRLLLHDHDTAPLTVSSLAPIRHDQLQLVYLSACRTAFTPAAELLDEAIHLTSAFQLAGSPHVIGTLWEINDALAVDVAAAFYHELRSTLGTLDTGRAAQAIHQAIHAVRRSYPRTPSLWAAYVHVGA